VQELLRCQAQLEPFYILARLVTVLRFGVLSDRSMFTSTDTHDGSYYCFFWRCCRRQGGSVTSSVGVLATARDVLTQQQQHQTEASAVAANAATTTRVCLKGLKLSPPYLYSGHCSSSAWKF
jgi:hypothetical protein